MLVGTVLALARDELSFRAAPDRWSVVRIAVVGSGSGDEAADGLAFLRGAELFAHQLDQDRDRPLRVELQFFDDQNDVEQAQLRAIEVAEGGFHAVIGHKYSSCSVAAGALYETHGIPAVSPAASDLGVTTARPWYFRTMPSSPRQAGFMADYLTHVLEARRVAVIGESRTYGTGIAAAFVERCEGDPGCEVVQQWTFDNEALEGEELRGHLRALVAELLVGEPADAVALAAHAGEAADLVKELRRRGFEGPIISPNTLASRAFIELFGPDELHLTQGLYPIAPLILDGGEPQVQDFRAEYLEAFGEEPDWGAALAYDAAGLIVGAAETVGFSGAEADLAADRDAIRAGLARLTGAGCKDGAQPGRTGLSGLNCFDEHGSPEDKDIMVGMYEAGQLISAPVQLQKVQAGEVPDLAQAQAQGMVREVSGDWMAKADIVYTGFELQDVSELDIEQETVRLSFLQWFRGPIGDTIDDVHFLNAVGDVHRELLEEQVRDDRVWRLYQVEGVFWLDWQDDTPDLDRYELGFSFHHRELSVERLRYVEDGRSMHLSPPLHLPDDWRLEAERSEVETLPIATHGRPGLMQVSAAVPEFSHFTHRLRIEPTGQLLRRRGRHQSPPWGLFASLLVLLFLSILQHGHRRRLGLLVIRLAQAAAAGVVLITFEEWLADGWWTLPVRPEGWGRPELRGLLVYFDAAWWLLPATLVNALVEEQVWAPLEIRTRRIPNVVRRLGTVLIFTLAGCGIIAFVVGAKLTSLVATSGVLTLVIGLGLQVNLENLMAGLALNLEQPFRIGDRVTIGDNDPGVVVDITWRTTKLRLDDGSEVSVPNLMASTEKLVCLPQSAPEATQPGGRSA
jgi:potassium efflux system protein